MPEGVVRISEKRVVRQYEATFKIDVAKLVGEKGYTVPEAAERLGIPKSKLRTAAKLGRTGRNF